MTSNQKKEEKVIINNSADLYKIPISILRNTKVYNFQGKYYEKIYKDAIDIENKIFIKKPPIVRNTPIYTYSPPKYEPQEDLNLQINQPIYQNQNQINNNNFNNFTIVKNPPQNFNKVNFNYNNQMLHDEYLIKKITFEIEYKTLIGQEIGIIGSLNELGKWNQEKVLKLDWNKNSIWRKDIDYINRVDFEFKFVLINKGKIIRWEEGKNRFFKYDNVYYKLKNGNIQSGLITIWNLNKMTMEFELKLNNLKIICDWNKK